MKAIWLVVVLLISPMFSSSKLAAEDAGAVRASSLAGVVEDANGDPIGQARADLLDCATMQVTKRSLADAKGNFILTPGWDSPEYCLRFSMDNYETVELQVKLRKSAGALVVTLPGGSVSGTVEGE
jgi:hypothetical protein